MGWMASLDLMCRILIKCGCYCQGSLKPTRLIFACDGCCDSFVRVDNVLAVVSVCPQDRVLQRCSSPHCKTCMIVSSLY